MFTAVHVPAEAVTIAILNYASFHNVCRLMTGKLNLLNKQCSCRKNVDIKV